MSGLLIGLTGGIGTGKSRVSDLLAELGAAVECSDLIVRELQRPGGDGLEAIRAEFGDAYLTVEGELDRPKLGALVFEDAEARTRLNGLIHPLVMRELRDRSAAHLARGIQVAVVDIPLLLEGRKAGHGSGAELPFDEIVVVYATEDQQLQRVMARDGLDEAAARARIGAQMSIEEKRRFPGVVVVDNTGDWAKTEARVRELYAGWVARALAS